MKIRHKEISFNFLGKGEWYEATAEEIEVFEARHPEIKVEREGVESVTKTKQETQLPDSESSLSELIDYVRHAEDDDPMNFAEPDEMPTYDKGWYTWHGKKYRKADIPPEAYGE